MESEEFYTLAKDPAFPDEMAFEITQVNPGEVTFSREGVTDVISHVQDFVVARLLGQWEKTGRAPKKLRMVMKLEWDPRDDIQEGYLPFFEGETNLEGLLKIDMTHRIPRSDTLDKMAE